MNTKSLKKKNAVKIISVSCTAGYSFTESKEDVIRPLLCLVQQRTDQLSLSGEVEGHGMSDLHPLHPRDQGQGQIQSLGMNTAECSV